MHGTCLYNSISCMAFTFNFKTYDMAIDTCTQQTICYIHMHVYTNYWLTSSGNAVMMNVIMLRTYTELDVESSNILSAIGLLQKMENSVCLHGCL